MQGPPSPSTASDVGINLQFEHLWGDFGAGVDVESVGSSLTSVTALSV